jgi:hypothetical protein
MGEYASFFARALNGELFISDMTRHAVYRFSARGAFKGFIGRAGQGPGELELPTSVVVLSGDSVLGVYDVDKRALSLFAISTERFIRQVPFPSQDVGASWGVEGDSAFVPLHMGVSLLGVWSFPDSTVSSHLPLPTDLASSPGLMIRHGRPGIAITDSGLAFFLPTRPGLLITDGSGAIKGTVAIPAARRKGEPADLGDLEGHPPTRMSASSADGIERLLGGEILVAHLDLDYQGGSGGSVHFTNFHLYLSALRRDLSTACVDGEIPLTSDLPPMPVFRGDTVFVLSRRVEEDDAVRTVLFAYRVDLSQCDWISTGGIVREARSTSR